MLVKLPILHLVPCYSVSIENDLVSLIYIAQSLESRFNKVADPRMATLLKRHSNAGVFL